MKILFPIWLSFKLIKKGPKHIISAYDDVNIMVMLSSMMTSNGNKILLSNHNPLSAVFENSRGKERVKYILLRRLLPWAFRRARSVAAVSTGVANDLAESLGLPRTSIDVIYNPVISEEPVPLGSSTHPFTDRCRSIVFVGRLVQQKDIACLIRAFSILIKRTEAKLTIVGEGPDRKNVEAMIDELDLSGHVHMAGTQDNPMPIIAASDVLALSSRYEGFGNVLIEAMACGTQVVSTDCPHGPAEILENGRWGQLVPVGDEAALALALERSIKRDFWVDPSALRARGAEFSVEKATRRYLELVGYDVSLLPPESTEAPRSRPASGPEQTG